MSIHSSLSSSAQNKKQKSVLKRAERLKILLEKGLWQEGNSVFGLPKIKTIRIKLKKEKAAPAAVEAGAVAEGETAPAEETKETTKGTKAASTAEKPTKSPTSKESKK